MEDQPVKGFKIMAHWGNQKALVLYPLFRKMIQGWRIGMGNLVKG
jgi:hypothetical protein